MEITRICKTCDGDGLIDWGQGTTRTCYSCHGTGTSDEGEIANGSKTLNERLTDLEDKINDIMTKCNDIFEAIS